MTKESKNEKAERILFAESFLKKAFKAQKRPTVYCVLQHISSSGMSRRIGFFVVEKKELRRIDWAIAALMNYRESDKGGLVVTGCGMDMGFHVVNGLSCRLYCPKQYDHDSAYRLTSEWK